MTHFSRALALCAFLLLCSIAAALAQSAAIAVPPGWKLQPVQGRFRGAEPLGYWSGAASEHTDQTLILLKAPHTGTLEEWAKAHLAEVVKDEPTLLVDEDGYANVCGKKHRAYHLRFRDTVNGNLLEIEQYAIKGSDDFVYFVTYSRFERQPAVRAARAAMTHLCLVE